MAVTTSSTRYPERTAPSTGGGGQQSLGRYRPVASLRDMITRSMWTDASAYVRVRGLAIPIDPWMRGTPRFAVRLGAQGSIWRPDMFVTVTQAAATGDRALTVDHVPTDLLDESLIQVNSVQRAAAISWTPTSIALSEALIQPVAAGARLRVHAFPVTIEEPKSAGTSTVRIASILRLTPGDQLEVPVTAGTYQQAVRHTLTKVDLVETDVEGYKYQIALDRPFARSLATDEVVYIRAYPAYFSNFVPIPIYGTRALRPIGPFLIDWASGPIIKDTAYTECVTYRSYRSDRSAITSYLTGAHNAPVMTANIRADQLLFWDCHAGSISAAGTVAYATCDANGHFRLTTKLAPHVAPPTTHATGSITAVAKALFLDNETITVSAVNSDTLVTQTVVFEFRVSDIFTPTPGRTTIDLRYVTTREQVAAVISAAISGWRGSVGETLDLDVKTVGYETQLVARVSGTPGNLVLTEAVTTTGFTVVGMAGGGGGLSWVLSLAPLPSYSFPAGSQALVRLPPNADQITTLSGTSALVIVQLQATDDEATAIDFRLVSDPGTVVRIYGWWARESAAAFIEHNTVVRLEQDDWAGSCLFVKPLWPSFDLLRPDPRGESMNAGAVLL
jgi:hypothetical protein